MKDLTTISVMALAGMAVPACAQEPAPGREARTESAATAPQYSEARMDESQADGEVANLPYARGRTFRTLDAYLAHLERQGAIDLPWWREVEPGLYERVVRMPGRQPERATRAELMRRFGFTR